MSLQWSDVLDIAIELAESKPDVDPRYVKLYAGLFFAVILRIWSFTWLLNVLFPSSNPTQLPRT